MKIRKYIKGATTTPENFMNMLNQRIDDLGSGNIESSTDLIVDESDIVSEPEDEIYDEMDHAVEDDIFYPSDEVNDEQVFVNYEDFIEYYNSTLDEPIPEEVIVNDLSSLQDAINVVVDKENDGEEIDTDYVDVNDCNIYWNESYSDPIIEVDGKRYSIVSTEDEEGSHTIQLIEEIVDDEDLSDELGIVEEEI